MARLIPGLSAALMAAFLAMPAAPVQAREDSVPEWGIALSAPAGYAPMPSPPGRTSIVASYQRQEDSAFAPRFNLFCAKLPAALPADSIPKEAEAEYTQGIVREMGGKPLGLARLKVGDREGVAFAFTARDPASGVSLRGRAVIVARNGVLYQIIFVAPEQRFAAESPAYEKVIRGVRWLGQGPPPAGRKPPATPVTLGPVRPESGEYRVARHGVVLTVPAGYRDEPVRTDDQPDGAVSQVSFRKSATDAETAAVARIFLHCDAAEGKGVEGDLPAEIGAKWLAAVGRNPENRDVDSADGTVAGRRALLIQYRREGKTSGVFVRERLAVFTYRRTLYVLGVSACEDLLAAEEPAFDAVLKSVRWLPEGGGAK